MTEDVIIDGIIERESEKYTNRPKDRGGPTKFGITLKTLTAWRGVPCTAMDVKNMKRDEAEAIYRAEYILHPGFRGISDFYLKELVIDSGVLHGQYTASKWLQACVGGLVVDGIIGTKSITKINDLGPEDLFDAKKRFLATRFRYTALIVKKDLEQATNLEGWINRVNGFLVRL